MATLEQDDLRSLKLAGRALPEKLDMAWNILIHDAAYEKEYDRFVKGMSYKPTTDLPAYKQALANLEALIQQIAAT
jgi:hypothetical protein